VASAEPGEHWRWCYLDEVAHDCPVAEEPAERAARPVVLTVDDDPSVSRAVARDLRRRYGADYRIMRSDSGEEALQAIKDVVLRGEQVAAIRLTIACHG
jgi:hypothetical protein